MGKKRKTRSVLSGGTFAAIPAELFRAVLVLAFSGALGLAVNAFSGRSLSIFEGDAKTSATDSTAAAGAREKGRVTLAQLMRAWNDPAQSVRVVDVRGQAEFDTGHVPSALHLPLDVILRSRQEYDGALQGATLIAVMCDSDQCSKADEAAKALLEFGYKNVVVLGGGWETYKDSGYKIEEARP